jgi:hypothetical protein
MEMKIIVGLYLPPGIVVLDLLVKMCHFGPINEFEKCVYRSAGYSWTLEVKKVKKNKGTVSKQCYEVVAILNFCSTQ